MSEAAVLETPVTIEHPATVEVPAPQPTIAEILDQHLAHSQQKRIAVETLSKIPFLIAPHGDKAISTEELKSPAHQEIVEASLQTILGERHENASYLSSAESIGDKLGLTSGSNFAQIDGRSTIKMLAEAGVKDFAAALDVKQSHAARVR